MYHSPELIFYVPKPNYSSYGSPPKILSIEATFATAAEANISGQTLVGLDMSKTVGESISLWYTTKEMRTISCQWWVGDSAGTEENALPGAVTFDPDKIYTVQVTITANPGASFASSAGVAIGHYGGHFTVPNGSITRTNDTLTFTATPIRQINLTMPAPMTIGDPLPTISDVGGLPAGVTVQKLEWPYTTGTTVPDTDAVRAALTLKTDGTRPILVREYPYPTVNGEEYVYANNTVYDGSMVKVSGIALPVKPNGVEVGGTITSYGDASETVTVTLTPSSGTALTTTVTGNSANYSFPTVPAGTYTLKVEKKGHAPFTKEITVGDSNVTEDVTVYLIGDVDGNGKVEQKDSMILSRYFAGWSGYETKIVSSAAADVDQDGELKLKDSMILSRYFAGWSEYTKYFQ